MKWNKSWNGLHCIWMLWRKLLVLTTPNVTFLSDVTVFELESWAREEAGRLRNVKRCLATGNRTRVSGISLRRHTATCRPPQHNTVVWIELWTRTFRRQRKKLHVHVGVCGGDSFCMQNLRWTTGPVFTVRFQPRACAADRSFDVFQSSCYKLPIRTSARNFKIQIILLWLCGRARETEGDRS